MILAIGIWFDEYFTQTIITHNHAAKEIAAELLKISNSDYWPDEIILIKNDKVFNTYNQDKDY